MNIIDNILPNTAYFQVEHAKKSIVLHHTAGSASAANAISGWKAKGDKVATSYVIAGTPGPAGGHVDGAIYRAFEDRYWGWHLGVKTTNSEVLNSQAIGIEICNWGQLTFKNGKYYNYLSTEVPADQVIKLDTPYRGFEFYHAYSDAQLVAVRNLVEMLCNKYNISKTYHENIFDVNNDALGGAAGIWCHTSFRKDKWDLSPQPKVISMLKSL